MSEINNDSDYADFSDWATKPVPKWWNFLFTLMFCCIVGGLIALLYERIKGVKSEISWLGMGVFGLGVVLMIGVVIVGVIVGMKCPMCCMKMRVVRKFSPGAGTYYYCDHCRLRRFDENFE